MLARGQPNLVLGQGREPYGANDVVAFDSQTDLTRNVRSRLKRYDVAHLQHLFALRDDKGRLGMSQADAVPEVSPMERAQAMLLEHGADRSVQVFTSCACSQEVLACREGLQTRSVNFRLPCGGFSPADESAGQIGTVIPDHHGEVQKHRVARF
jgi:hypothetical protein